VCMTRLFRGEISWKVSVDWRDKLTKKLGGVRRVEAVAIGGCSSHDIALFEAVRNEGSVCLQGARDNDHSLADPLALAPQELDVYGRVLRGIAVDDELASKIRSFGKRRESDPVLGVVEEARASVIASSALLGPAPS